VLSGARKLKVDAKQLAQALARSSDASPALIAALAAALQQEGAAATPSSSSSSSAAAAPKLLGLDWSLSAPVASSALVQPGAPFVTLQLHMQAQSGELSTHCVQASLAQLALIETALREAALSLDRA